MTIVFLLKVIKSNGFFKGLYQIDEMNSANVKVGSLHELYLYKQFIWQRCKHLIFSLNFIIISDFPLYFRKKTLKSLSFKRLSTV